MKVRQISIHLYLNACIFNNHVLYAQKTFYLNPNDFNTELTNLIKKSNLWAVIN